MIEIALQLRDSAGLVPDFPRLVALFGCAVSIVHRLHWAGVRIVSLLPSTTEIVCLLGLEVDGVEALARVLHSDWFSQPIPPHQTRMVSADGQRLEPYR